jgi:hypothetical protein
MSDEPVYEGGGFGDASTAPKSENLRIRMEVAAEMEAAEAAKEERDRKRRAEISQERAIQHAIAAAVAAGEYVNPRQAMQGGGAVGHEPREFIERASFQMDQEDFQAEASAAAEYRRWLADRGGAMSADTSAPTPAEAQRQLEADQEMRERMAAVRTQRRHHFETLAQAREQTARQIRVSESYR